MTNINSLTELDLYQLKALEHYDWVDDDLIPEETRRSIINFSLEDLKSFFDDLDPETFRAEIQELLNDYPKSYLKDQLNRIKKLIQN